VEAAIKVGAVKEDGTAETLQEKLAREKAERKAAAVERSRQRQADKAYFERKKEETEELAAKARENEEKALKERQLTDEEKMKGDKQILKKEGGLMGIESGGGETDPNDPFAMKNKSKIGGKYA
ncbi:hypothetical protein TeGR_g2435, partial [Tetraparma gracilis]